MIRLVSACAACPTAAVRKISAVRTPTKPRRVKNIKFLPCTGSVVRQFIPTLNRLISVCVPDEVSGSRVSFVARSVVSGKFLNGLISGGHTGSAETCLLACGRSRLLTPMRRAWSCSRATSASFVEADLPERRVYAETTLLLGHDIQVSHDIQAC